MPLDITLADITARLRQGKFPNEQAISQGIVLRVFQELGWDTWDTNVVWPEYQTGERRADFALCHRRRNRQSSPKSSNRAEPKKLFVRLLNMHFTGAFRLWF